MLMLARATILLLSTAAFLNAQAQSADRGKQAQERADQGGRQEQMQSRERSGSGQAQSDMIRVIAASELVGLDVRSSDRRHAGEIEYVLISPAAGVTHALVGEDGELEVDDGDLLIVPFSALDVAKANDERVPATASLEAMRGAISIGEDQISELTSPMVMTRVYEYFYDVSSEANGTTGQRSRSGDEGAAGGQMRGGEEKRESGQQGEAGGMAGQKPSGRTRQGEGPEARIVVMRNMVATLMPGLKTFGDLQGMSVATPDGETFGEIDEIILSAASGEVLYALVAHGGFLGIGEDWYAVPLEALRWDADANAFVANMPIASEERDRRLEQGDLPTRVPASDLEALYRSFDLSADRLRVTGR